MNPQNELLDAIQVLVDKAMESATKIYNGTVTGVNATIGVCSMTVNGRSYDNIKYYGGIPTINAQYRVFVPEGNMSWAFSIVDGGGGGGGPTTVTVNAGTATALPYGASPTVNNSGDETNAVFNFGIPSGPPGATGATGPKGDTGAQGPQGIQGVQGPKGDTGNAGATGPQGPQGQKGDKGDTGYLFTPSVSAAGVISWSNDGGLPNPPSQNIKGPQGVAGPTGPIGPAGVYYGDNAPSPDQYKVWIDPTPDEDDLAQIKVQGTQPAGQNTGDFWFQIV